MVQVALPLAFAGVGGGPWAGFGRPGLRGPRAATWDGPVGWKPGHYLLLAVSLYALVVTFAFSLRGRQVAALRQEAMAYRERAAWAPEGYMLPLPGACLPSPGL